MRLGDSLWAGSSSDWLDTKPGEYLQVDWHTGAIKGRVRFDRPIFGLAYGAGSLWFVVGRMPATLVRVDPVTRRPLGTPVVISEDRAIGLAFGEGAVWATSLESGRLIRFDPTTGLIDTVRVGENPVGVVVAGGRVWVANRADGTVSRVDPTTMREVGGRIGAGRLPTWIAAAAGSIWVSNQADGTVTRIDSEIGATLGSPIRIAPTPNEEQAGAHVLSASDDGSVWVASVTEQTVSRIDPRN